MIASRRSFGILVDPSTASLKRIAWAYGCAKKGSDEEAALYTILVERMRRIVADGEP